MEDLGNDSQRPQTKISPRDGVPFSLLAAYQIVNLVKSSQVLSARESLEFRRNLGFRGFRGLGIR